MKSNKSPDNINNRFTNIMPRRSQSRKDKTVMFSRNNMIQEGSNTWLMNLSMNKKINQSDIDLEGLVHHEK